MMNERSQEPVPPDPRVREPIFLLPGSITALIGVLVAIHLASILVLNPDGQIQLLFWFAFQPYRIVLAGVEPNIVVPLLWTPFSHAFLHAGWDHLLINLAWLVRFATPVVRRYGAGPMLALVRMSGAGVGGPAAPTSARVHSHSLNRPGNRSPSEVLQ